MPAGGVNHPDSDLAGPGKLSAKKSLGQVEGSILSNSRNFKVVRGGFPTFDKWAKWAENTRFPLTSNYVWDLKVAVLFVLAWSSCPSAINGVSEFQISNRTLVKFWTRSKLAFFKPILSSLERH